MGLSPLSPRARTRARGYGPSRGAIDCLKRQDELSKPKGALHPVPVLVFTVVCPLIAHIDQKNETDLSFLQRLAVKYDAVVKPVDGKLVFSRRGQTKSLSGQSVPAVELQLYQGEKAPHNALLAVSFVEPERDQFLGVRADFHDIAAAEIIRFETGQTPFKQLPGRFKDQGEAIEAAEGY